MIISTTIFASAALAMMGVVTFWSTSPYDVPIFAPILVGIFAAPACIESYRKDHSMWEIVLSLTLGGIVGWMLLFVGFLIVYATF
jgi:TctA family transporter